MYVRVEVTPGAKKERITNVKENVLKVQVREPAERNMANTRVRQIVAETYGVKIGDVRMVAGHRSPVKMFDVVLKK